MDLSKLSDADLQALSSKQYDKLSDEGLASLHSQLNPADVRKAQVKSMLSGLHGPYKQAVEELDPLKMAMGQAPTIGPLKDAASGVGEAVSGAAGKLGSYLSKSGIGSGAANDVLGVVSPRAAKLVAFFSKLSSKAAPEVESAAGPVSEEAEALVKRGVSKEPTTTAKTRIDPFTKKVINPSDEK